MIEIRHDTITRKTLADIIVVPARQTDIIYMYITHLHMYLSTLLNIKLKMNKKI